MTEEEKKAITREKHPGRVAQGHKLAALMKKRKEETLRDKEQSNVQPTGQSSVQSTEQPSVQLSVQSYGAYIYGVGIVAVLTIGVCVCFTYNKKSSQAVNKEQVKEEQQQTIKPPKRRNML